ncbi:MAG: type IV pili methyl-accepting chemotaxis transducer N-terminal domain-containing protein, partial [Sinobacterium sp.]|nr:type IV pili methyl-accepting chemotaxis transducer N-terminal domain-containing protein [Sinobacterium sp.]
MKEQSLKSSIITRYGLIMAVIIGLSVVGMLGSMLIAESLDSDAVRINTAGSLRMHAYKISQAMLLQDNPAMVEKLGDVGLQINAFENKLYNPALKLIGHGSGNHPLEKDYLHINTLWLSLKADILQAKTTEQVSSVQLGVNHFVSQVDDFVFHLQHGSENKVRLLRVMQGIILFSTLVTAFLALYDVLYNVVDPLRSMVQATKKIRQGDFDTQVYYEAND